MIIDQSDQRDEILCFCLGPYPFKNMAIRNRLLFFADHFRMILVSQKPGDLTEEIKKRGGETHPCPFKSRSHYFGLVIFFLWACYRSVGFAFFRRQRIKYIYSIHDITMILGWWARLVLGHPKWISDILDDPALEWNNWKARTNLTAGQKGIRIILWLLELIKQKILKRADLSIVQGVTPEKTLPQLLVKNYALDLKKTICVPNGVALEDIRPSSTLRPVDQSAFVIFYVGYISRIRGIGTILEALAELRRRIPAARLELAGAAKEADRQWLSEEVERLALQGAVRYHGEMPSEDVWRNIESSSVCVFPFELSYLDYVIPVKVFEFLALRRPLVSSNLEGVASVIQHGYNGLLVEPGNVDAWVKALYALATDAELYQRLSNHARPSIESFAWENINQRILQAMTAS